jgi:hypothetical protein
MKILQGSKEKTSEYPLEYRILVELNSPYLVKLVADSFYQFTENNYCFVIEYCEVKKIMYCRSFQIFIQRINTVS